MEIQEANQLRPLLFEAIEYKVGQLYYATRSKQYTDEVREYIFVMLRLTAEYISIHKNDFRLRNPRCRFPVTSQSPIKYMESFCEPKNFQTIMNSNALRMTDIHAVRRWVWFVFNKILEIHSKLEKWDYKAEHDKRFIYIRGQAVTLPGESKVHVKKKRRGGGGGRFSTGTNGFGSNLTHWERITIARKEYQCFYCPQPIYPGQEYRRDVIRMDKGVEIVRYHTCCPTDPNDPVLGENRELIDQTKPVKGIHKKTA